MAANSNRPANALCNNRKSRNHVAMFSREKLRKPLFPEKPKAPLIAVTISGAFANSVR